MNAVFVAAIWSIIEYSVIGAKLPYTTPDLTVIGLVAPLLPGNRPILPSLADRVGVIALSIYKS